MDIEIRQLYYLFYLFKALSKLIIKLKIALYYLPIYIYDIF